MSKVAVGNVSDSYKIENLSVRRLMCNIRWNTTNTSNLPQYENIVLRAVLTRNGKQTQLFNSGLHLLMRHCMFFNSFEHPIVPGTFVNTMATNIYLIGITIDLGKCINLKGSDTIELFIQQLDGWVGTTGVTANSNITYTWREDIGNETVIPTIQTRPVQTSATEVSEHLGDNVTEISIISTLTANPTDANRQIDNFSILSDRYNVNDTLDRLISRRLTQFESFLDAQNRGHCFKYVPNTEIDNCRVEMKCNSANVTSGSLWIVYNQDILDEQTYQRAVRRNEKHAQKDASKRFKQ